MTTKNIISWDLGGTKCAAALVEYDSTTNHYAIIKQHSVKLSDVGSLDELVEKFETRLNITLSDADAICIGAAGIYNGEELLLNAGYPFRMNFAKVARQRAWGNLAVIHDYAPVVCATFTDYIRQSHCVKYLNNAQPDLYGRRVALGIGTGLGLKDGILFANGDFWLGNNEMGHIGIIIPPQVDKYHHDRHLEFMKFLVSEGGLEPGEPLTFEKILSGKGTVRMHQFVHNFLHTHTPEEIGELMRCGEAQETTALFAWYLGLFVSVVQLAFMPMGGIWITGGVILKHLDVFEHPDFYKGIEASPAYMQQRQALPLAVMQNDQYAFMGAAYYAVKHLCHKFVKC
jgi:glucokinase